MIRIPTNNQWAQTNRSDIFGSLWSSFNLTKTKKLGSLLVSPRTIITTDDISNLGVPVGFRWFDNKYYTVAGGRVFSNTSSDKTPFGTFSEVGGGSPTNCSSDVSDIEVFNDKLYVTTNSNSIYKFDGTTWTNFTFGASSTNPHMLTVYGDRLYVTTLGSKGLSIDSSDVVATSGANTLTLLNSDSNLITFIRPASDGIWVGTLNTRGGKGRVYKWDGENDESRPNASYRLNSAGALAGIVKDDTLYIIDANGKLLMNNGGTFTEIARLPVKDNYLKNTLSKVNDRWIHPNGITEHENHINILINNENRDNAKTIQENFPSGIWEYDNISQSLYHKMPLTYHPSSGGSVTDYGQNRISRVGALSEAKSNSSSINDNGSLLIGAQYYSNSITTAEAIWIDDLNDTIQKYGYFVTSKIFSNNVEDVWQRVYVRHRKLLDSASHITVKYRTEEQSPTEFTITWVSDSEFITSSNPTAYQVGDEVEIMQGKGGGKTAHIVALQEQPTENNWLIGLDDTFTGVGGTAKARFQKWKKISVQTDQNLDWLEGGIGDNSVWIQLKVCMQFKGGDEIHDIIVDNSKKK